MTNIEVSGRQLLRELEAMRRRISELERAEAERRQAEEKLRQSQARLRTFMESAADVFVLFDAELNFVEINRAGLEMFPHGIRKEDLIGRNIADIMPDIKQCGRYDQYMQVIKTGKPLLLDDCVPSSVLGERHQILKAFKVGDGLGVIATDITELKRAGEALKESEERFKAILDNAVDGIILADLETKRFCTGNKAICQMLGYSLEEIWHLGVMDIHPEKDLPYVLGQFEKQARREITLSEDIPVKRKDGSVFYAEVNSSPVTIGGKGYLIGIFRDTTERKRKEEALSRSEEKYRGLYESIIDGVVHTDLSGKILGANRAFLDMVGYSEQEMKRLSYQQLTPAKWAAIEEDIVKNQVLTRGYSDLYEKEYIRKDGTVFPIGIRVRLVRADKGKPVGMWGIVRDITELKRGEYALRQSEEKLRLIFDSVTDGITVTDLEGNILQVNEAITRMHGFERKDRLVGRNSFEFLPEEERMRARKLLTKVLETGHSGNVELALLRKDGTSYPVEISGALLKDGEGNPTGFVGITRDIAERNLAQKALVESEKKYSTLVERGNDGIIIIQDGLMKFINTKMIEMSGYSTEEAVNKSFIGFVSPGYQAIVAERYKRRLAGEEVPRYYEIEIIAKDGTAIPVEINASIIEYESKPADMAIVRDITERRQAEQQLRESEERYRNLFESTYDLIQSVAPDGRLLFVNRAWREKLGYTEAEIPNLNLFEIIHPESLPHCQELFSRVMAGEPVRDIQTTFVTKGGSPVLLEGSAIARHIDGKLIATLGFFHDITERTKAEERVRHAAEEWRTTFDSITDAISIHDKDYKILRVNRAFADIVHMKPKQLIGKRCYEVVHGTKEPLPGCPHRQSLTTGKPATLEFYESHLGRYLQQSTSPILNEKGEVVSTVHIARDITERKRMEEQLIMTDRLASIGELVSGIAHELNNPLTSVIGFSQLLKEAGVSPDVKEDLDIISKEAERAAAIIRNLLTFARKHEPVKQQSHINSIIEDVLKLRAYEQKVNNIAVRKHLARNLPEIMVDYFQMQQVFLNIIVNAEMAMLEAHNKGTLNISTRQVDSIIRISIADDGPGISKENLNRIFDPFFTTKEVGKGTGLGLSICHGIVTAHGGSIYARSKPGIGAAFVVELPVNSS